VELRIATELVLKARQILRSLKVPLDGPKLMSGDKMLVFKNISMQLHIIEEEKLLQHVLYAIGCARIDVRR
jgi:hypothetical protein